MVAQCYGILTQQGGLVMDELQSRYCYLSADDIRLFTVFPKYSHTCNSRIFCEIPNSAFYKSMYKNNAFFCLCRQEFIFLPLKPLVHTFLCIFVCQIMKFTAEIDIQRIKGSKTKPR